MFRKVAAIRKDKTVKGNDITKIEKSRLYLHANSVRKCLRCAENGGAEDVNMNGSKYSNHGENISYISCNNGHCCRNKFVPPVRATEMLIDFWEAE